MKNALLIVVFGCLFSSVGGVGLEKWIVVTTIQYPTEQLRKLTQIPGWRLVVVGDRKTPADWQLDNCDYLSPQKQLELGYECASLLPWNHYSRKNIGYLYAIEHGAHLIYETDDDNESLGTLSYCRSEDVLSSLTSANGCVNVYTYFGRPDLWPRGYPLEEIVHGGHYEMHPIALPLSGYAVGIEQGIVNNDPDVDAIFRLVKNCITSDQEIQFTPRASCYLPPYMFCPFNSQNTVIHRNAFFTLYLPSSVNMRVSDIWRSYIAQRLLWEDGQVVVFSGPNAVQVRNEHHLLTDFFQEEDLYLKSGRLVGYLRAWKNTGFDLLQATQQLVDDLVTEDFLGENESAIVAAWLRDLQKATITK